MQTNCWEWKTPSGGKTNGYGQKNIKGKHHHTHRLAWAWANGPIPAGMMVLHKCDNPPCVNPDHLFLGTGSDNMVDAVVKGRQHQVRKTHCPKGHPYDIFSTYRDGDIRSCRRCKNKMQNAARARRQAATRSACLPAVPSHKQPRTPHS